METKETMQTVDASELANVDGGSPVGTVIVVGPGHAGPFVPGGPFNRIPGPYNPYPPVVFPL
jgi:hypothetical protein